MRIAAQYINNNGVVLSKSMLNDMTMKYTIQYGRACTYLYNLGYAKSPSYCSSDEMMEILLSIDQSLISLFSNKLTGTVDLTVKRFSFVLLSKDLTDEIREVLGYMRDMLEAETALGDFGELLPQLKFTKKSDKVIVKTRLNVGRGVTNNGKGNLDSPYVQELLWTDSDMGQIRVSYRHILLECLLHHLGATDEEIASAMKANKSLILGDGYTYLEGDCEFYTSLVSGSIIGRGKYGQALYTEIERYYEDYYATRTTKADCISFEDKMYLDATDNCIAFLNSVRDGFEKSYVTQYVTSDCVYFAVESVDKPVVEKSKQVYVGSYVYDYGNDCFLSNVNRLRGFSGEFVASKDLDKLGLIACCSPIQMWMTVHTNRGTKVDYEDYYPLFCCRHVNASDAPTPRVGYSRNLTFKNPEEVMNMLEVYSLEAISREIANVLDKEYGEHTDDYRLLVGSYVRALICIDCDQPLTGFENPNEFILKNGFDWLNDIDYMSLLCEAESVFEKLGF